MNVTFTDHSEKIKKKAQFAARLACFSAAEVLRDAYRENLLRTQAPPHSEPDEIPHKYNGPLEDGWGWSTNGGGGLFFDDDLFSEDPFANQFDSEKKNNNPATGFAKTQTDFLATYIETSKEESDSLVVKIGFTSENSHVVDRSQNYLIEWDQGKYVEKKDGEEFVQRPWIIPVYKQARKSMISAARSAIASFASAQSIGGDVPF